MRSLPRGLATASAILLSFMLSAQSNINGQKPDVEVYGRVGATSENKSHGKMDRATVLVVMEEDTLTSTTDRRGNYSCALTFGHIYEIHFRAPGLCSKHVEIDTGNVPLPAQKGGFHMEIDMSLPSDATAQQTMILEELPIGKASYNKRSDNFVFDHKYTKRMRALLGREFEFSRKKS